MDNPEARPPYAKGRDCSLGFCSIYCPQWCYFYFPPPPSPSDSTFTLSPLLIVIIVVVSSAFLIVAGYLIAHKYCNNIVRRRSSTTSTAPSSAWLPPPSAGGLDVSLMSKLTTFRYRRTEGPIADGDRDCSVCLGEFRDGDSLCILPKCAHAFHQTCIDTWLSSHSNCPLCRAGVVAPVEELVVAVLNDLEEERPGSAEDRREEDDHVMIEIREEGEEVRLEEGSSAVSSPVSVKTSSSSGGS